MKNRWTTTWAAAAALILIATATVRAHAASPEWESPPVSHKDVLPYFDASSLYLQVLPPPPLTGSEIDRDDVAAIRARQQLDAARVQQAQADGNWLYDSFAAALGVPSIRREQFPALVRLLNRSVKNVGGPAFAAKAAYPRLRPYQRLENIHVCGQAAGSKPDPDAKRQTSYPSGHSSYGWTTALVLARVSPEHASAILERASDYAQSRLICGMHFPSDIEAGRQLATAVVAQLDGNAEFQADLAAARQELAGQQH